MSTKDNNWSISCGNWELKAAEIESFKHDGKSWDGKVGLVLTRRDTDHSTTVFEDHIVLADVLRDLADQIESWTKPPLGAKGMGIVG